MAFEAYLQAGSALPSRGRRVTYTVSIAVHAAAVLIAVGYSFWHVEELTPPRVEVTFVSAAAAPPPPPPPPALGGGSAAPKHKAVARPKVETAVKLPEVAQPKIERVVEPIVEAPQPPKTASEVPHESAPLTNTGTATGTGKPSGVAGGEANGITGGVPGGTGTTAGPAPKFLPPMMGSRQKISGADPDFPSNLAKAGASYLVIAKICVGTSGAVEAVTVLKHGHPTLDNIVMTTLKTWRYRPLTANGRPVPFCYPANFQFKTE
jgi:protein TonB